MRVLVPENLGKLFLRAFNGLFRKIVVPENGQIRKSLFRSDLS